MVDLEALFPKLAGSSYTLTSPATQDYNCIAWAAGDDQRWWWPDAAGSRYWPGNVARDESVSGFQAMFESLGYAVCSDEQNEAGFEKIALFANSEGPQHGARQLPNGRWTSKLGELDDIEHDLRDLEGTEYGTVVVFMKRATS
jgi:hypothetical protein